MWAGKEKRRNVFKMASRQYDFSCSPSSAPCCSTLISVTLDHKIERPVRVCVLLNSVS